MTKVYSTIPIAANHPMNKNRVVKGIKDYLFSFFSLSNSVSKISDNYIIGFIYGRELVICIDDVRLFPKLRKTKLQLLSWKIENCNLIVAGVEDYSILIYKKILEKLQPKL